MASVVTVVFRRDGVDYQERDAIRREAYGLSFNPAYNNNDQIAIKKQHD